MSRSLVIPCLAVSLLCGCNRGSPTAPSMPPGGPRSGIWIGAMTDAANGEGTVRIVLSDTVVDAERSLLSGTWTVSYADAAKNGNGSASGTVAGASGTLLLSPAIAPVCPPGTGFGAAAGRYVSTNLAVTPSAFTGAYLLGTCSGTVTGTIELRKQ